MITDEKTYLQVKFSINYVHKRLVEPLDKKLAIVDVTCLLRYLAVSFPSAKRAVAADTTGSSPESKRLSCPSN
jgi:hypothetical protein